jgi:hypothetical protein
MLLFEEAVRSGACWQTNLSRAAKCEQKCVACRENPLIARIIVTKVNVTGGGSHSQRQTGVGTLGNTRRCSEPQEVSFERAGRTQCKTFGTRALVYYYYIAHVSLALFK